jgi:predicted O-methyltransferase YrrM
MFHSIDTAMQRRMKLLEAMDAKDRQDGTPRLQRLRQIPPETGRFIALLAATAPEGRFVEVGTSAGYSGIWISLACRERACKLVTFEVLEEKARLARETFHEAGVEDSVELVLGDARAHLSGIHNVAFCFLDAEKDVYADCYEAVVPNLVPGGLLVADNALNHFASLQPMIERALADPRVDATVASVGKGELICRRIP